MTCILFKGSSNWYFWYQIIFHLAYRIFSSFILIILNIFNIAEYRHFIISKAKVIKDKKKYKSEIVFTRLVIIGTFLFIFALLYNINAYVIVQSFQLKGINYDAFANINILVSYEVILFFYIFDIFIYLGMDTNLKKLIKKFCNKNISKK